MIERLRFFVAGPYCPYGEDPHNALRVAQVNVDKAIEIGNSLIERGHYAFVPHLTHYLHIHYSCMRDRYDWYYEYDNSFLDRWANAMFVIAPSPGTNKEVDRARSKSYPIYYHLEDVPIMNVNWEVRTFNGKK